jgi:hypothetical protein
MATLTTSESGLSPVTTSSALSLSKNTVPELEFLGQVTFPRSLPITLNGIHSTIGGLSGLTYNRTTNEYYAISDDRLSGVPPYEPGEPTRFYTLNIDLNSGSLSDVSFSNVTFLRRADGSQYLPQSTDTEAISVTDRNTVFVASEGEVNAPGQIRVNPFINEYDLSTGKLIQQLPIPEKFLPDAAIASQQTRGTYDNLAFETAALTPDQKTLWTATENALFQDGPRATPTNGSRSRFLQFNLTTNQAAGEYLYNIDPVRFPPIPDTGFSVNGITDMLPLNNSGDLFVIERSYAVGGNPQPTNFSIKLYKASVQGATDISGIDSLNSLTSEQLSQIQPVQKQLVLDLNTLNLPEALPGVSGLDNIEGITFGPRLPDGRQSLILVADSDFNLRPTGFTQFLAFAIDPGSGIQTRNSTFGVTPGGDTTVTFSSDLLNALGSLGVQVQGVGGTQINNGSADFAITGGAANVDSVKVDILHSGGLALSAGGTTVDLTDFEITSLGDRPTLTGLVTLNGDLITRAPLFDLNLNQVSSSVIANQPALTLGNVGVNLSATAATTLNQAFGVNAFTTGFNIGSAEVEARLQPIG